MPARGGSTEAGKAPVPPGLPLPLLLTCLSSALEAFPGSLGHQCVPQRSGGLSLSTAGCWGRGHGYSHAAAPRCIWALVQIMPVTETVPPSPPVFRNGFSIVYYLTQVTPLLFKALTILVLIIPLQY